LKTTLNTHPADGVRAFEEQYPAMCKALGRDPSTKLVSTSAGSSRIEHIITCPNPQSLPRFRGLTWTLPILHFLLNACPAPPALSHAFAGSPETSLHLWEPS
jgi:hypothetical protein